MNGKPIFFKLVFPKIDPDFPIDPEAEIHARHDDTYQRLTPKFVEAELDGYIDGLIKEFEHIRQKAKRRFALAKNEIRA